MGNREVIEPIYNAMKDIMLKRQKPIRIRAHPEYLMTIRTEFDVAVNTWGDFEIFGIPIVSDHRIPPGTMLIDAR